MSPPIQLLPNLMFVIGFLNHLAAHVLFPEYLSPYILCWAGGHLNQSLQIAVV